MLELYGHRSRVWTLGETKDFIVSASEDTTCKLWYRDPLNKNEQLFHTLSGHLGKSIRALATFQNNEKDLVATGGDDGAVKIYDISLIK